MTTATVQAITTKEAPDMDRTIHQLLQRGCTVMTADPDDLDTITGAWLRETVAAAIAADDHARTAEAIAEGERMGYQVTVDLRYGLPYTVSLGPYIIGEPNPSVETTDLDSYDGQHLPEPVCVPNADDTGCLNGDDCPSVSWHLPFAPAQLRMMAITAGHSALASYLFGFEGTDIELTADDFGIGRWHGDDTCYPGCHGCAGMEAMWPDEARATHLRLIS